MALLGIKLVLYRLPLFDKTNIRYNFHPILPIGNQYPIVGLYKLHLCIYSTKGIACKANAVRLYTYKAANHTSRPNHPCLL